MNIGKKKDLYQSIRLKKMNIKNFDDYVICKIMNIEWTPYGEILYEIKYTDMYYEQQLVIKVKQSELLSSIVDGKLVKTKPIRKPNIKSIRKSIRKSIKKPNRKSIRKSIRKPNRKSIRKSIRKPIRKPNRKIEFI